MRRHACVQGARHVCHALGRPHGELTPHPCRYSAAGPGRHASTPQPGRPAPPSPPPAPSPVQLLARPNAQPSPASSPLQHPPLPSAQPFPASRHAQRPALPSAHPSPAPSPCPSAQPCPAPGPSQRPGPGPAPGAAHLLQHGGHLRLAADLLLGRADQAHAAAAHLPDVHRRRRAALWSQQVFDLLLRGAPRRDFITPKSRCSLRARGVPRRGPSRALERSLRPEGLAASARAHVLETNMQMVVAACQ